MKRIVFLLSAIAIVSVLFIQDAGIARARADQPARADRDFRADRADRERPRSEIPFYREDRADRDFRADRANRADRERPRTEMSFDGDNVPDKTQSPKTQSPKTCPKCGGSDIGVNYLGWKWCKKCGIVIERP